MMKLAPTPRSADVAITGRCNLDCQYCFYADEMVARGDLPTDEWAKIFAELSELGVMNVSLSGGEVFTRPDLFELIDLVIANRMRYSILTNATAITEKNIAQLKEGKRFLRLDSVQVSIDGSTAEIHSLSRPTTLGGDSFRFAVRGLRLLVKHGFPVSVRTTINRHNLHDLENTAKLILEDIGVNHLTTNDAYSCGATDRAADNPMLSPEERIEAMAIMETLDARYPGKLSSTAGPHAMNKHYKEVKQLISEGKTEMPSGSHRFGRLGACGCAYSKIAILHDGTISPCNAISEITIGKMGEDSLKEVWLNADKMGDFRSRHNITLDSLETCKDCEYQAFCTGGCPAIPYHMVGDMNTRSPMDCMRIHEQALNNVASDNKPRKPRQVIPIIAQS